jgi:hypothetical protein
VDPSTSQSFVLNFLDHSRGQFVWCPNRPSLWAKWFIIGRVRSACESRENDRWSWRHKAFGLGWRSEVGVVVGVYHSVLYVQPEREHRRCCALLYVKSLVLRTNSFLVDRQQAADDGMVYGWVIPFGVCCSQCNAFEFSISGISAVSSCRVCRPSSS